MMKALARIFGTEAHGSILIMYFADIKGIGETIPAKNGQRRHY
jgi:hypothetical protein